MKILFVVHPDSVIEQSSDVRHVKPFIDRIKSKIQSFDGIVVVSKLDEIFYLDENKESTIYIENFMKWLKGTKANLVIEGRRNLDVPLGTAAHKYIDDLYLEGNLEKIILCGCFTHKDNFMCVDVTYRELVRQYGPDKVEIDPTCTLKAGPVFFSEKEANIDWVGVFLS